MSFWNKALTIAWKDVISETRTREIVFSVLVFAILVIVVFNFAFGETQEMLTAVAPGILWVTFAFSGVLSLNRAFVAEKEDGCLEGLMACPIGREVIYAGKLMGSLLFMLVVEAIALPVFMVLFNLPVLSIELIAVTVLATIGFAALGTLFSALATNTRAREMVLPILFLPLVVPVIIAAVKATGLALAGQSWSAMSTWLSMIIAFDIVFLVVSYLVFPFVIEE
ncbi:MAG: heme exporter protein CcmB [Chloroflexota bacterium]